MRPRDRAFWLFGFISSLVVFPIRWSLDGWQVQYSNDVEFLSHLPPKDKYDDSSSWMDHSLEFMSACLMVRDDNALLPEWLAYHYTMLPLRDVIVGADMGSTQDPSLILQPWQMSTDLQATIWKDTDFMHRFGPIPVPLDDENHHYLHRQRAFFTSCTEVLKARNRTWVAYIDTDEYIALRPSSSSSMELLPLTPTNKDEKNQTTIQQQRQDMNESSYWHLKQQKAIWNASTVLEALQVADTVFPLSPCHCMPRLLFGSLENETCPNADPVKVWWTNQTTLLNHDTNHHHHHPAVSMTSLSTLRYVQHAEKGAFYPSKWGKVLVDVSRLSLDNLAIKPKSSHRPFRICPVPLPPFEEAMFQVNHYLGSWERYQSRNDSRRSRKAFEDRAYFSHGVACDLNMHAWLPKFVQQLGLQTAQTLLYGTIPP